MTALFGWFVESPASLLVERFLLWSLPVGFIIGVMALAVFTLLAGTSPVWRYRVAVASSVALLVVPLVLASVTPPPVLWGLVVPASSGTVAIGAPSTPAATSSAASVPTSAPEDRSSRAASPRGWFESLSATLPGLTAHAWPIAALLWLVIASILVLRVAAGLHGLSRLRAVSLAAPPELAGLWARAGGSPGSGTPVEVRVSSVVPVPLVAGWRHPWIILPAKQARALDDGELAAVLAHERAHIERNDHRTGPVLATVAALTFFHPVAWWLGRVVRTEREFCCDDVALDRSGSVPARYAAVLARLAVASPRGRSLALTGGALLPRLERLRHTTRSTRVSYFRRGSLAALLASFLLVLTAGFAQEPAVADSSAHPPTAAVLRRTGLERVVWLTSEGSFDLSEDGRLVTWIEPGGRLVIEELVAPDGRRGVVIEGDASGTPVYRYMGDRSPAQAELGSTWLRRILTDPLVVEVLAKQETQETGASRGSVNASSSEAASFVQLPLTRSADLHERQAQWMERFEHTRLAEGLNASLVQQLSFEFLRAAQLLSASVYDDAQFEHVMSRRDEVQDALRKALRELGGELRFRWLDPESP